MSSNSVSRNKEKYRYVTDENGEIVAIRNEWYTKYLNTKRLQGNLSRAGIPLSIMEYDIGSYVGTNSIINVERMKKYVANFDIKFSKLHFYLYGPNNCQKTTLSWWIGRELIKKGKKVKYILMNDLVKILTKEFEEEYDNTVMSYLRCDCLIIDESFMKERMTIYKSGYQIPYLDSFLRKRLDISSTIFISNIDQHRIDEGFFNPGIKSLVLRTSIPLEFCDSVFKKDNFNIDEIFS